MKKNLTKLFIALGALGGTYAQTSLTGPSSSQSPYLNPLVAGSTITSIFTTADAINGYTMSGLADGAGAFDNGNGSFTMLIAHEIGSANGSVRAHGSTGAFVSKWVINKSNLSVVSGTDLIQDVNLWTGTTYTTYNATNPSTLAAFGRFCSADLPPVSAFYNSVTGKGTTERIFMGGEESGSSGRVFGHIVTGTAAGVSYELPHLGKASWENNVASPYEQDKTIVIGTDDATPGQVYVYVGTKTTSGSDVARAGLTNGKLYGVAVLGLINETSASVPAANTTFNLLDLGSVQNLTGATINTNSNNMGITNFLRPEDGAWDPSNPRDFYFVTTNSFNAPSRMWRLRFHDIRNPEQGGTITAVLSGTEGQKMLDNIGMNRYGQIMLQEDPGNVAHIGKIWQYNVGGSLSLFAQHDTTRFLSTGANFLTQDEESSGIIDAQEILGPGMWLMVDQAHYGIPAPVMEGGQILALYNPSSANANPEISVSGNSQNIAINSTVTSGTNNTNYGSTNVGTQLVKTFVIQNAGPGPLAVSNVSIGGMNAGDFTLLSPPVYPFTIPVNGSLTIYVRFAPGSTGTRMGKVYVMNNDFDESFYPFTIEGNGVVPEINVNANSLNIVAGNTSLSTNDNTDFGTTYLNVPVTKTFEIQNTGTGTLNVSSVSISGNSSFEFSFINAGTYPANINAGNSMTFAIQYLPVTIGTRTASVNIFNDDADEANYAFIIGGKSTIDVGIDSYATQDLKISVFPNPATDIAILNIALENNEMVAVQVADINGKIVRSIAPTVMYAGNNEIKINTSEFASGVYMVAVQKSNGTANVKMLVNH